MTDHVAQLRAMLAFERSLVDRVGPPGCAARETAAANVAALEWVLGVVATYPTPGPEQVAAYFEAVKQTLNAPSRIPGKTLGQGSPDAWNRSRPRWPTLGPGAL